MKRLKRQTCIFCIFLVLPLLLVSGLTACAGTDTQAGRRSIFTKPGSDHLEVSVSRRSADLHLLEYDLTDEEVQTICAAIKKTEQDVKWAFDVTEAAVSCQLYADNSSYGVKYNYCADNGILNDLTYVRSLQLTKEAQTILNGILSQYVSLSTQDYIDILSGLPV